MEATINKSCKMSQKSNCQKPPFFPLLLKCTETSNILELNSVGNHYGRFKGCLSSRTHIFYRVNCQWQQRRCHTYH